MWRAALVAAVASSPLYAQSSYAFANVPWTATHQEVRDILTGKGYVADSTDKDGDEWFMGRIEDTPTRIFAYFDSSGHAVKFELLVTTADDAAKSMYNVIVDQLTAKYGKPDNHFENFDPPYERGDGYELQAIQAGKATFLTCWDHGKPPQAGIEDLCVDITKNLTVEIDYESAGWHNELERRRKRSANDL
jgi:hypothetical protein